MADSTTPNTHDFISTAKRVIKLEQQAIDSMTACLNSEFNQAANLLLKCTGRIVVIGMGKSGHIAGKIAATLASTGSPSFFVHPGEASHGDLGMITKSDVVLAISNSGETAELLAILPVIHQLNVPLISITSNKSSMLARKSTVHLDIGVVKEACPLNLAPTASTTATLVLGDALAIALLEARGFTEADFALSHPGGSLGKKLLLRVHDIMHRGDDMPIVQPKTSIRDAVIEMTEKRLGMTAIMEDNKILGIFTDGDLRRSVDGVIDFYNTRIDSVMNQDFITIDASTLAYDALQLMQTKKINALVVTDETGQLQGVLNMHDILRAGINS